MIKREAVRNWLNELNAVYTQNRQYLTDLDSPIGDADHGINLARGFNKVAEKINGADKSISDLLKDTGMTLVSTVGGSSGPLYGTFFMRASSVVGGREELDGQGLVEMFEAGLSGVLQRGKAELGDKTMVDAMTPAIEALKNAVAQGKSLKEALEAATAAAEEGMKATIPMLARKGRASYLGERSIGHQDPGATSTYMMFKAASDKMGESE